MMYEAWYNLHVSRKSKMGCVLKNLGCCSWENGNIFSSDDSGFDRTFNTFLHLSFPEKSGRSIEEIFFNSFFTGLQVLERLAMSYSILFVLFND